MARVAGVLLVLLVVLPARPAGAGSRRGLGLTSFELTGNQRAPRAALLIRLRAAAIEQLELIGENVKILDNGPVLRRCGARECQLALAQEQQADIWYGEVEQKDESAYVITGWIWRFDSETRGPLTEYPVSLQEVCEACDDLTLTQRVAQVFGALAEQQLVAAAPEKTRLTQGAPIASNASALSAGVLPPPSSPSAPNNPAESKGRLGVRRKLAASVLLTVSAISLITAVTLSVLNGAPFAVNGPSQFDPSFTLRPDYTTIFAPAYGLAVATAIPAVVMLVR